MMSSSTDIYNMSYIWIFVDGTKLIILKLDSWFGDVVMGVVMQLDHVEDTSKNDNNSIFYNSRNDSSILS